MLTTQEIQTKVEYWKRVKELWAKSDRDCNCGGPAMGTDHSPDCKYLLAWDDAVEQADDEKYLSEQEWDGDKDGVNVRELKTRYKVRVVRSRDHFHIAVRDVVVDFIYTSEFFFWTKGFAQKAADAYADSCSFELKTFLNWTKKNFQN